jgi:hypothetical protein
MFPPADFVRLGKIHQMLDPSGKSEKSIEDLVAELQSELQVARIDRTFYELAIKERDFERRKVDRLEGELADCRAARGTLT